MDTTNALLVRQDSLCCPVCVFWVQTWVQGENNGLTNRKFGSLNLFIIG